MNIENEKIVDLPSLVKIVLDIDNRFNGQVWWRGQSNIEWNLHPSVFRYNLDHQYEQNIIKIFRQRAISRDTNTPESNDDSSWLFLMQHHGLPTRLLDWTMSPLFACFFAVEDEANQDYDGALFALSPLKLNFNQVNVDGILLPGDGLVERVIHNAFSDEQLITNYIVGILPPEMHIRVMLQLSVFTLHGVTISLDNMTDNFNYLLKFKIPKKAKNDLKSQLKTMGVRESNLFPDLDHLAKEIKSLRFRKPSIKEKSINGNPFTNNNFNTSLTTSST